MLAVMKIRSEDGPLGWGAVGGVPPLLIDFLRADQDRPSREGDTL